MRVIKAGVMDEVDLINKTKPQMEFFVPDRIEWVNEMEGVPQIEGNPPAPSQNTPAETEL
jgi:hypothetical protein